MLIDLDNNSLQRILNFLRLRPRLALRTTNTTLKAKVDHLHLASTTLMPILFMKTSPTEESLSQTSHFLVPAGIKTTRPWTEHAFARASRQQPSTPALYTKNLNNFPSNLLPKVTQLVFNHRNVPCSLPKILASAQSHPPIRLQSLSIDFFTSPFTDIRALLNCSPIRELRLHMPNFSFTLIKQVIDVLHFPEMLNILVLKNNVSLLTRKSPSPSKDPESFTVLRAILHKLPNLREFEMKSPFENEFWNYLNSLPQEEKPQCLISSETSVSDEFRPLAGLRAVWLSSERLDQGERNFLGFRVDWINFANLGGLMRRRWADDVEWRMETCLFELEVLRSVSGIHEIVSEAWEKFGVGQVEKKEEFEQRSLMGRLGWALAMSFVSTMTRRFQCIAEGEGDDWEKMREFLDGVVLALRMRAFLDVDGFWRRQRKLVVDCVVVVDVPEELKDWIQIG